MGQNHAPDNRQNGSSRQYPHTALAHCHVRNVILAVANCRSFHVLRRYPWGPALPVCGVALVWRRSANHPNEVAQFALPPVRRDGAEPRDAGILRRRARIEALGDGAVDERRPLLLQQRDQPLFPFDHVGVLAAFDVVAQDLVGNRPDEVGDLLEAIHGNQAAQLRISPAVAATLMRLDGRMGRPRGAARRRPRSRPHTPIPKRAGL